MLPQSGVVRARGPFNSSSGKGKSKKKKKTVKIQLLPLLSLSKTLHLPFPSRGTARDVGSGAAGDAAGEEPQPPPQPPASAWFAHLPILDFPHSFCSGIPL